MSAWQLPYFCLITLWLTSNWVWKTAWRLTDNWLTFNCLTAAWWLLDDSLMTAWQLPDNCQKTDIQLPDNCLMTLWRLPDNCLTTAWQLYDDCMTTAWWLSNNCETIAWWLSSDHQKLLSWLCSKFWQCYSKINKMVYISDIRVLLAPQGCSGQEIKSNAFTENSTTDIILGIYSFYKHLWCYEILPNLEAQNAGWRRSPISI